MNTQNDGLEIKQWAFDVYQWAQTIKWPSCKEPLKGDCGITFLELLANFLLVTGKTIPVTIKRLGTRITWAPFNSEQAYIQPQRARSAMAQAVVLDSIIQQLNRIFNMSIFPMPKRIGIKSLSHFGHCTLQKRTGYVCRPELKHTKETIFLVNTFLNDCRDNQNYNLSMRVSSYFKTPPVPICMSLQNPATVITPEQVIYRRNKLYGRRRKGQWQHCLQRFICGVWRYFLFRFTSIFFDEHLISGGIFSDIWVVVTYGIQVWSCIDQLEHILVFILFRLRFRWYPAPTKVVGTGCRGKDQQAMRWFGKGGAFLVWPFLVSIFQFLGGVFFFQRCPPKWMRWKIPTNDILWMLFLKCQHDAVV